jgi:outer membrane immunogenic protein
MRRVLLASVGMLTLTALVGPSGAADLPRRYNPVVPPAPAFAPAYNWTGFYLGINGGGGWGHSAWTTTTGFDVSGGMIGGTAGYNWQMGQWVLGVEGDVDWTNFKGNTVVGCPFGCQTSNSWLATVRGRVGYAFDRVHALCHGRRRVWRCPRPHPGLRRIVRHQCRLDSGRRA